jgi:PAS domain S-box-containing protein
MASEPALPRPFAIVGVGVAAGGLAPLREFFEHVPDDLSAAFAVVTHALPDFTLAPDELLAGRARLPVRLAAPGVALEPSSIYLLPPGELLAVSPSGVFEAQPERGLLPIDAFFDSLAAALGPRAAAVVLSGGDDDGTRGIGAVSARGGMVLVQDPASAECAAMPRAAVLAGYADHVLAPRELGRALRDLVLEPPQRVVAVESRALAWVRELELERELSVLRAEHCAARTELASLSLLHRLGDAALAAPDARSALELALREVCEACRLVSGEAWLPDPSAPELVLGALWQRADVSPKQAPWRAQRAEGERSQPRERMRSRAPASPLVDSVWRAGQAQCIEAPRRSGAPLRVADPAQRAAFAVPVRRGDSVLAVLGFTARTSRIEDGQLDLAEQVADRIAGALERKQVEARQREAAELARQVAENVNEVFYVRDCASGRFLYVSPAYEALWERNAEALLRDASEWADAVHPDDRGLLDVALRAQGEQSVELRYRILRADGSPCWVHDRAIPMRTHSGELVRPPRVVGIVRDLTSEREIDELSRSNEDLEQFASAASHDLKAPLRGLAHLVDGIADDLDEGEVASARAKLAQQRAQVERMQSLIDGLLAYARAGGPAEGLFELDTREVIEEATQLVCQQRALSLEYKGDFPVLRCARAPLRQVFVNLLGNAVVHHDGEKCRVAISVRDAGSAYEFCVADDGPGIPRHQRKRVFEFFRTLKPASQRGGIGMGLPLVRRIVRGAGGDIELDQNQPRGLVVRFTWPKNQGEIVSEFRAEGVSEPSQS